MLKITHKYYTDLLFNTVVNNNKAFLNLSPPCILDDIRYFKSNEGISYLKHDGFMGGLCRIKQGDENLTKLHQQHRIKLGGYFLECYEGKLSEMYAKQGFKTIAKLKFNPQFAPDGWEHDKDLKKQPSIVFMSLYDVPTIQANDYKTAYTYASISKNISTAER